MKHRFAALLLAAVLPAQAFDFEDVARRAQTLAAKSYEAPDMKLPGPINDLSYDQYRDIRFKPDRSFWRGTALPFELQFFHLGMFYREPVKLHLIDGEGVRAIPFNPEWYDYGKNEIDPEKLREALSGYAGLRVHYPLNNTQYKDELLVFQGASYFRALARGARYGLSARGLALDTGAMSGEEFPRFTEFWIEWPRPEDRELTLYALLDSRRVAGAYRFQIKPGETTVTEVRARLYLRDRVDKVGIAPLTSMFEFGENDPSEREDYRPEVHDSDGLSIQTETEWLWRPLVNPRRLLITSFGAVNPKGFGLMQRDRHFDHYEDLEARYELRPSLWVVPKGDWGAGRVELVQIPTPDETNDNIVAYWVPNVAPEPGTPFEIAYSLRWELKDETRPPLARVVQSRRGHGYRRPDDANTLRFTLDFEGGAIPTLKPDELLVSGIWVGENGRLLERQSYRNEATGGWRVSLRIAREDENKPVELRCLLVREGEKEPVSETWSYVLPPGPFESP